MMNKPNHEWLAGLFQEGIYIVPGENKVSAGVSDSPEPDEKDTDSVEPQTVSEQSPLTMPDFRGGNKKHILILTDSIPDSTEEALLTNIMGATGLTWDDIALINWYDQPRPDLLSKLESHVVISFGLEHDPWCDTDPYQVHHANGVTHLRSDALRSLNSQIDQKRKLWSALKEMFGV
ncbi:hypothetical protein [Fulvivirga sedimenti]|uniref:Uncharacterized protein n=1 Tax=Fulvivirga sedimenti TaxID=2879465 RepID=A0A9X1KVV7_9BACT|nr:hypothetical protein [Fulvivirga sedimenti]MCA6073309.1 hypothetical protein [Fulvivirga sedimenti]